MHTVNRHFSHICVTSLQFVFFPHPVDRLFDLLEVTVFSRKPCAVPLLPLETGLGVETNEHHF